MERKSHRDITQTNLKIQVHAGTWLDKREDSLKNGGKLSISTIAQSYLDFPILITSRII